jgi:hypothetical protein
MTDHDRFRESLVLHLAGELDRDESEALRAHLQVCAACNEEAAALAPLAPPSRALEEVEGLERWRSQVLANTIAPAHRSAFTRRALAAAAVFLLGVGAGLLATRSVSSEADSRPSVARTASRPEAASPFALREPPPESRPSGFLALAGYVRPK